ncbi:MAG: FeoB small GTPase domain-containing protein [Syntrophomonadaceae bacterium]|nr:FeoB small GTPase domain-containing protein [Syntrophomonadaceae bacterium]
MAVVVVGNPNVGKSLLLNRLTGSKMLVSNYSGTSVEIKPIDFTLGNRDIKVYDTPGIYSIYSADARSIMDVLSKKENISLVINIVDAVNLERSLVLTQELKELNKPVVVVVNQIDRARSMGLKIDAVLLSKLLGCPVVLFSAMTGEGFEELTRIIEKIETDKIHNENDMPLKVGLSKCQSQCKLGCMDCSIPEETCMTISDLRRVEKARTIASMVTSKLAQKQKIRLEKIQALLDHPFIGTVLLLFIAYLGFVVLLKFINISEGPITALLAPVNIFIQELVSRILPEGMLNVILSQAIPEGLIIPFTIIMPAMLMVSLMMSILEDTGLLPRYSVALERVGSLFGVSGQAVIPLSLGFGCRTPAVVAARVLPTEAERFIIITLLSIVIPCAATLGILASVIVIFDASLVVIIITMISALIILSFILSRLNPGEEVFVHELPPLRIPLWFNVWHKVKMRFSGFFTEVLPLLLIMSIGIRAILESGVLSVFSSIEGFSRLLFGIPSEALIAVLVTIFQRYMAPLILLNLPLTPREATIAIAMITLSLPCLPVMVMTVREIGGKNLLKILGMGLATSCSVGIILNLILP